MDFFNRVREVTKLRGTTIEQMMISVTHGGSNSPRDIYNGWRRRNVLPRADTAVEIAKFLNVTVEYLVTGNDREPNEDFYAKYFQFENLLEKFSKLSSADKRLIESSINNLVEK